MTDSVGGDRFLELEDARLRWRIEGSGPALLLLHGWALDLGSWDLVAPLLARHFTVLRFDRRGFGLSSGLPDIHRNVDDLAALLGAAQIQRTGLLGMSQGARLAIHFAQSHPSRVRALILDGAPAIEAETELPLVEYRAQLQTQGEQALQSAVLRHPLMQLQSTAASAREVLALTVARYRGVDLLHPVARAAAPDLRQIRIETLILNGSRDSAERLEAGRLLRETIAGAQRMELAGAGHLAMLDDPEAYADAVIRFYRNVTN